MNRLLLVEDEPNVGSTLRERLEAERYEVEWVKGVADAIARFKETKFDLAILDVSLPDGSGFEIGQWMRENKIQSGILFLTAFGSPEERVQGLELGAEDYVVKPFHLKELLLRIKNALRRVQTGRDEPDEEIQIGRAVLRFSQFRAFVEGQEIALSHKECALLEFLLEKRGAAVSRTQILDRIWPNDYPTSRTVDNFIVRLRKLVEDDPEHPELIQSVRGVGYRLA